MEESDIKVSVCLITYNHEKFIARAIEGIATQRTNFRFEVIIGEDMSTDCTRKVCEEYAAKYPQLIKLLPSDKNHGPTNNELRIFRACTGKYIAMCEGDDYWSDDNKLQKQADFLDAHEDYSMCFSYVDFIDETGAPTPPNFEPPVKDTFGIEDIVVPGICFIPTATLLFRNILPDPMPDFYMNAVSGDIAVHLLMIDKGKAKYFSEKMAVYRHHPGGITKTEEHIKFGYYKEFLLYESANAYFNGKYEKVFRQELSNMSKVMLIFQAQDKHGMARLKHYFNKMPDYLKYSDGINWKEMIYYHVVLFFPFLLRFFKKPA